MNDQPQSARSPIEAAFSLGLMLVATVASCVAWRVTGTWNYLVAGVGFLVLALLWYRLPISFKALRGPIGVRLTPQREFTMLEKLCALFGYGLVLVAIGLRLFSE
jgi:hypothetical protein